MHKDFYTSGFIYHFLTEQICLQQPLSFENENSQQWILFSGKSRYDEDKSLTFQRVIKEQLEHSFSLKSIYSVYDYFHSTLERDYYVQYAEIATKKLPLFIRKGFIIAWFPFKQIAKLPLTYQTRQDITVGQRVIDAAWRNQSHAPAEDFIIR